MDTKSGVEAKSGTFLVLKPTRLEQKTIRFGPDTWISCGLALLHQRNHQPQIQTHHQDQRLPQIRILALAPRIWINHRLRAQAPLTQKTPQGSLSPYRGVNKRPRRPPQRLTYDGLMKDNK